jgi:hypothetical protein
MKNKSNGFSDNTIALRPARFAMLWEVCEMPCGEEELFSGCEHKVAPAIDTL